MGPRERGSFPFPSQPSDRLREPGRAPAVVVAVVAVQLGLSLRFFVEYVGRWGWVVHLLYVAAGTAACVVVLRRPTLTRLLTRSWTLALAVLCLVGLDLVAFPRADALREVGRGSDQDDCVRSLVRNVFAGRPPFGEGYFGDPCSTGPSEFFVYLPVQLWSDYFVIVPALVTLFGYGVLRIVAGHTTAVLLSLTQFVSWMFLELSAVGSDLLVIGWMFGAGTAASYRGLGERNGRLIAAGTVGFVFVAGSRVPLVLVVGASLALLLLAFRATALRVVVPAVLVTAALYLAGYALAPDQFRPGHLVGKSAHIVRYLVGDTVALPLVVFTVVAVAVVLLVCRRGLSGLIRRQYLAANVVLMGLPLTFVAVWDLHRRALDVAEWEALHYLWLCVPTLLVAAGDHLGRVNCSGVQDTGR